jgi:sarcosine oxidase
VAPGAWAGQLLPFLKPRLTVARQTVGYFTPAEGPDAYRPGRFPVWMYMGDGNDVFYGMPEFGRAGVKAARHIRYGADDDADQPPQSVEQDRVDDITRFMARSFTSPGWTLAGAEHCLYTVAPDEDFIIDLHPENPRIALGAGFSGHGFKFGPLTGRLLAELAWEGKFSIPEANTARRLFSLAGKG